MSYDVSALPLLTGGTAGFARAISTSGHVIVGSSTATAHAGLLPVTWTDGGAATQLPLFSGKNDGEALATSANGSVVVGFCSSLGVPIAISWTNGGAAVSLGALGGFPWTVARGVSGDGSVIAGISWTGAGGTGRAVTWTSGGAPVALTSLFPGLGADIADAANGVSGDGTIVVGSSMSGTGWRHAVSWTNGGAPVDLGSLAGDIEAVAIGISSDGTTIVGYSFHVGGPFKAVAWINGGSPIDLGFVGSDTRAQAYAASSDGSTITGFSSVGGTGPWEAAYWDGSAHGLTNLAGANDANVAAYGISGDASIIVGRSNGGLPAVWQSAPPPSPPAPPPVIIPPSLGVWRGQVGINWKGLALVGDAFSNVVGLSDFTIFTEYGNRMQMLVTSPPIHSDRKRIFVPLLEIEVEAGEGIPGNPDVAPLMSMEVSKDGGITWRPLLKTRSMGKAGEYIKRLRWLNLGEARTWVFRFTYTDSARPAIIGTYIETYKGLG